MEVKNQMVEQALINIAAQSAAERGAQQTKDTDQASFEDMVTQKRTEGGKETSETRKPEAAKTPEAQKKEEPVANEQYAIAAALMYQAQPDIRYAVAQEEPEQVPVVEMQLLAAEPETVQPEEAETLTQVEAEVLPVLTEEGGVQIEKPLNPEVKPEQAETETVRQDVPAAQRQSVEEVPAEEAPKARVEFRETEVRTENEPERQDAAPAAETPLFERVDAPVVKVAEAERPVPLEEPDGAEQVGRAINETLVYQADADRVEISLTPESLGRITVEITRGTDGTLSIVLHTENQRAANLLERGMDGLRQTLAAGTGREVQTQIQVRGNENAQQQFLNPDGQNRQDQGQQRQQGEQQRNHRNNAQEFLQQLRLGLVGMDGSAE